MINKQNIYFIGIGGIGMSALARYFMRDGQMVGGYDLTKTDLTEHLKKEGARISYKDNPDTVPDEFKQIDQSLVVFTPAIPGTNKILNYFVKRGFTLLKRSELLGEISRLKQTIAIAGTHGKTSISTFTAHLLMQGEKRCNAFLGGISVNYNTNFLFHHKAQYVVVEADEYDRSFLNLNPYISAISSVDADHLDIYGNYEQIRYAFESFINKTHRSGFALLHLRVADKLNTGIKVYTYSLDDPKSDFFAFNIKLKDGLYQFDLKTLQGTIDNLKLNVAGKHNLENSVAAAAIATIAGITDEQVRSGFKTLTGVERRFQLIRKEPVVYIDDYAHHPVEMKACIESAKEIFPGKQIAVLFQPHLYSRTKDFYHEFARELEQVDVVGLLPVYPAREDPIPGINSEIIAVEMQIRKAEVISKNQIGAFIRKNRFDVFITMGAGDIGNLTEEISDFLIKKDSV